MRETLRTLFIENPMMEEGSRAMRRFFRTGDAPRVINFVAAVIIGLFYLWLLAMIVRFHEDMTTFLLVVEVFIVTGVIVASIYGAVAGERERATWEALIITRITPAQIIVGKVIWRMALAVLVVVLMAIPIAVSSAYPHSWNSSAVVWTTGKLLLAHSIVLAWAFLLCAYGLWISARSRRSVTAAAILAGSLLAALLFIPMLLEMFGVRTTFVVSSSDLDYVGWTYTHLNPFIAVSDLEKGVYIDQGDYLTARTGSYPGPDPVPEPDFVSRHWSRLIPWLYLLAATLLFFRTNRTLHRLEEPSRRSDK